MKQNIPSLLFRKYPFATIGTSAIIAISTFITGFIFIFKPFGFSNYEGNQLTAAFGFGVVTLIALYILCKWIKPLILRLRANRWNVISEILFILILLLSITFGNLLYFSFMISGMPINISAFIHVAFLTFSIGVIPTVASVLFHYHQITTNKLSRLIDNNSSLEKNSIGKTLTIESTNKTEKEVTIKLSELLYIEAIKNHIHIHYLFNGEKESKIIRNTLSQIEETMGSLPLFRCHRSYIINLDKIKNAKGNSNGYKITLQDCDTTIPVSRSYVSKFTQLIY